MEKVTFKEIFTTHKYDRNFVRPENDIKLGAMYPSNYLEYFLINRIIPLNLYNSIWIVE